MKFSLALSNCLSCSQGNCYTNRTQIELSCEVLHVQALLNRRSSPIPTNGMAAWGFSHGLDIMCLHDRLLEVDVKGNEALATPKFQQCKVPRQVEVNRRFVIEHRPSGEDIGRELIGRLPHTTIACQRTITIISN